jgi:hypothetical protein
MHLQNESYILQKPKGVYNAPCNIEVLEMIRDRPMQKCLAFEKQMDQRLERFEETLSHIEQMDLSIKRPTTMIAILKEKVERANDLRVESGIVEDEYRNGMNDPSRMAAQWERLKGVKKVVGKKKVVERYMERVNHLDDNKIKVNKK